MRSRLATTTTTALLLTLGAVTLAGALSLTACKREREREEVSGLLVILPRDADATVTRTSGAAARYLEAIAGRSVTVLPLDPDAPDAVATAARRQRAGLVLVLEGERFDPARIDGARVEALGEWGFVLETQELGDWRSPLGGEGATVVWTAGASRLAEQYAVYELLRRLGARFFHPEQEYIPRHDKADLRALARRPTALHRVDASGAARDYTPDFDQRSWSFHGSHPLEILEPFSDGDFPFDQAERVNDWIVKNRGNRAKGLGRGVAGEEARSRRQRELVELHALLGFPSGVGITLHNQQQGASAVIDPSGDVPVKQQIEDYVAKRLAASPDAISFGIHFGPTEVTTTPDRETVDWINWAGRKALALRPDIRVEINNHISGAQPTPNFDDLGCPPGTNEDGRGDYYDLAFHTDPRFSVSVHTVMFYPLEGPARVYNQRSFAHKLCLMKRASAQGRPLKYFPEGSWWLSFDNPVPVYLPLYMATRARDIELIKPLLAARGGGTLHSHHMFNSGQEWGYWQQDYAVGLMHWNADVTLDDVLGELLDPLCPPAQLAEGCAARTRATAVLRELMAHQEDMFLEQVDWRGRPGGRYLYFAGEDAGDELAALAGFEFRPVVVRLDEVAGWEQAQLDHLRDTDLQALAEAERLHAGWLEALVGLQPEVPEAGRPWLDEIVDGVEINLLRAQHARGLYAAVVSRREAELRGAPEPAKAAAADWARAEQALARAEQVVRRREAAYRYPVAQTHGGGVTPETAVDNGTTYGFRVHTKTHLLTYWRSRHEAARALIEDAGPLDAGALALTPALAAPGQALSVTWPESQEELSATLTVGARALAPPQDALALGEGASFWPVAGSLRVGDVSAKVSGGVARASIRARSEPGALALVEPRSELAQMVLKTVFPAVRWAWLPGPEPRGLVWAADVDGDGVVPYSALALAPAAAGAGAGADFSTSPISLRVPLAFGKRDRSMQMEQVVFRGAVQRGVIQSPVHMTGELVLDDVVGALIELAGYEREGALKTLGGLLGFDPAAPPASVRFAADVALTPE